MTESERQQHDHLDVLMQAYTEALAAHGVDGVLLYSGRPARHFGDDQDTSFAAYGHFVHWTGQAQLAHSWLLIRPGVQPTLTLHAPADFWHLPARLPEEPWVERFRVEARESPEPPPLPPGRFAVLGDVTNDLAQALGAEANPPGLVAALDELRVRKSDYEVSCLREANRRAMAGHRAAREAFEAGGAEFDIQLAYLSGVRQRESELPYPNIVGLNAHGGVLHYQHYDTAPPAARRSLLVDAGRRYRGYCADITRTWAGGDATPEFAPLIEGVTALQQRLITDLAPGVSYVALHERMHEGLAALLVAHGLVDASAEAVLASGLTRAFCPHGLGHLLGVQVHDVGGRVDARGQPQPPPAEHPVLRLTRELEAGMVVTMEPGLYIIPMLLEAHRHRPEVNWGRVEHLADHGGIRIEDNVLVTADGPDNLTPREH
ncbi:MAG: Xaa-Pro dipeptidase [Halomonas sp.]|uniref:Xaa-Pro dipeptidase n=1 Tax=Halomonas sp. TaxID=1486246 RepID=UPI0019E01681|nr:Xaa-Pro dipeptidase [Halomonas sp.]MBE0489035.1 Xaa-Pro dipeptidase [Halomonas sp.]